ncbi:MAG: twin-arginine translocase TatA/TatE family subunit [Raineya sp.]|nr:twin-arginine translocase TatA/TatE family subunit [Raineya sp.]
MQKILLFLGLQPTEIFLIVFALLLLFGAKKIPELARGLGRGIREFKDATREVKKNIEEEISETPTKEK